jgi:signal recognition particle subunit SRP54
MASRILGMGDVLTLIERAEQAASEDETEAMEARMRKGQFTFDDFLSAQKMLRRMGPLQGVLKMIPGLGNQLDGVEMDDGKLKQVEAIVLSMTPRERAIPHSIDGKRRQRIARGSGTSVEQVNQLLEARKMMEKMMKTMGKGKMPSIPGMPAGGMPGGMPGLPGATAQAPQQSSGMSAKERQRRKKAKRKASRR